MEKHLLYKFEYNQCLFKGDDGEYGEKGQKGEKV